MKKHHIHPLTGKRIKETRKSRGLTQIELARKADIGYSTVQQYENGTRTPSIHLLSAIAEALAVSPEYLLCKTDIENKSFVTISSEKIENGDAHAVRTFLNLTPEDKKLVRDLILRLSQK